ncbi:Uncharacterised protein [Mycobacteroides abscessus]|nr:Uncharacterised protein [Mycobacteroides abscessus]
MAKTPEKAVSFTPPRYAAPRTTARRPSSDPSRSTARPTTRSGMVALTARASRTMEASGSTDRYNRGYTGMQCPPTAMPGRWMWLYGCELLASMTAWTSIPCLSAKRANWFASPMFTSRYVVSASFASSEASAEPRSQTPLGRSRSGRSSKSSTAS